MSARTESLIEGTDVTNARSAKARSAGSGALAALSLSMLLSSLGTSVANVALPTLARSLGASFQAVQWIVLAYLLAVTTMVVGVGRLGDIVGRRRLLLGGVSLFTSASLVCGIAPALSVLLVARGAQGIGAAVMMALTMAFVGETVPKERTGSAMGLLGTMSAIGTALGPSFGGVLLAGPGWRALFLINVPLGAVALVLTRMYLPADREVANSSRPAFDFLGTALLAFTLGTYALGMTTGRGNFGVQNAALLGSAALGAALFARVEARSSAPLVRLSLLADRMLSARLAANALVSTVVMATLVVGPFYLTRALSLSSAFVGLVMSVGPIVAAIASVPAGRLSDHYGVRRVTFLGLSATALGATLLWTLPARLGVVGYAISIAIVTAGYSLFQTANNAAVMSDVGADERGVVAGLLALSRNLGLVTGASVMGALFALASGSNDIATAAPAQVALGMRVTFAIASILVVGALLLTSGARVRRVA